MLTAKRITSKWSACGLIGLLVITLAAGAIWSQNRTAVAQDNPNLLTNASLERPYYGQGSSTRTVPQGWSLWVGSGAPDAFPHTDRVQVLDGEVAWNIKQGYVVFTVAGYQQVGGLKVGESVTLTGNGWVYTCNDTTNSCIINDAPYRRSDTSAGVTLKVGIDTKGGTDPNAASVKWSGTAAPYDQWATMTITAAAEAETVTVFLYATQSRGLAMNNVYWDKISLVRTAGAAIVEPTAAEVPFVVPQNVRPDGSIIHVVQSGDTLASIAYAYYEYGVTTETIAALNPPMKPNTRFLTIGQEIVILPPGSVDPTTGKLIPAGSAVTPQPTPAASGGTVSTPIPSPTPSGGEAPAVVAAQPSATPAGQPPAQSTTYTTVRASFVPFEHGVMIWLEDVDQIYVLIDGTTPDQSNYSAYRDTWQEGMPETDPSLTAPAGQFQPTRSFGQAWRTYPGVRDALGWATAESEDFTALVVRQGNTIIVGGPDGRVYELLDTGTWQAIDYYAE